MQAARRYVYLICIMTAICLLMLIPRRMHIIEAEVRNNKAKQTFSGLRDDTLTHYAYMKNKTRINTGIMRKAIDHTLIHRRMHINEAEVRNIKAKQTFSGLRADTLTHYAFVKNETHINTGIMRKAIDHIHQKDFVKPEGEECEKRFPTAMIVGVDKCGTRELTEFLHLHPLVEVYSRQSTKGLPLYEMDYFSGDFSKGADWFLNEMPCSYSNQITFMKDSTYFSKPKPPERIYNFNPNMKLILMVREPVARAISRFMYEIITNRLKNGTTLEEVIFHNGRLDEKHNVLKHSSYDESMKIWLKYFSLSQIMIIEGEDFKHRPGEVLANVEEFLGLPHAIEPDTFVWNEEKGYYCIKTDLDRTGMSCYGNERGKTLIDINPKTKEFLTEYFRLKNRNFRELIGRTFESWNY